MSSSQELFARRRCRRGLGFGRPRNHGQGGIADGRRQIGSRLSQLPQSVQVAVSDLERFAARFYHVADVDVGIARVQKLFNLLHAVFQVLQNFIAVSVYRSVGSVQARQGRLYVLPNAHFDLAEVQLSAFQLCFPLEDLPPVRIENREGQIQL